MIAEILAWVARVLAGTSVFWTGGEPDDRQRIYFANHTSHLDFTVLWSALPASVRARTRPVAARDYWEKSALKRYLAAKIFRAVLVDRLGGGDAAEADRAAAAKRTIETILSEIGNRDSLIVFPEGTRGSGRIPGPFKSGLYHLLSARPDLEAMPVYLDNMNRILPKGESVPVPMLSRAIFGHAMKIAPGEGKAEFLERAREAVIAMEKL